MVLPLVLEVVAFGIEVTGPRLVVSDADAAVVAAIVVIIAAVVIVVVVVIGVVVLSLVAREIVGLVGGVVPRDSEDDKS